MEACTVTAPDAITAFAVPNPNCSSQSQSVFSGLVALRVAPPGRSPSLLRISNVLFSLTLSAVDGSKVNVRVVTVNAQGWCILQSFTQEFQRCNLLLSVALLRGDEFGWPFPQRFAQLTSISCAFAMVRGNHKRS